MSTQVRGPETHEGSARPRAAVQPGARVRQSQHWHLTRLSSSRTTRSADAPSSLFSAQTKLVGLLLPLWMGCPPQGMAKQLRLMLLLTKGSMKMAEKPPLPPEHPLQQPKKAPLLAPLSSLHEARSPEQVGSHPIRVCPNHGHNLSLEERGCGRHCHSGEGFICLDRTR